MENRLNTYSNLPITITPNLDGRYDTKARSFIGWADVLRLPSDSFVAWKVSNMASWQRIYSTCF